MNLEGPFNIDIFPCGYERGQVTILLLTNGYLVKTIPRIGYRASIKFYGSPPFDGTAQTADHMELSSDPKVDVILPMLLNLVLPMQ